MSSCSSLRIGLLGSVLPFDSGAVPWGAVPGCAGLSLSLSLWLVADEAGVVVSALAVSAAPPTAMPATAAMAAAVVMMMLLLDFFMVVPPGSSGSVAMWLPSVPA
ncbi:MAG TPA: hypothetical protein VHM65_01365, partial [Candidatus Lustribacter sp.]|nr:hypothetical protein [Candidatus Lustribacter sp.]